MSNVEYAAKAGKMLEELKQMTLKAEKDYDTSNYDKYFRGKFIGLRDAYYTLGNILLEESPEQIND